MSERNADVSRRGFLRATAGGAGVAAASGATAAQENQTQGNQTEGNQTQEGETVDSQTQGNQTGGNETQGNESESGNESEGGGDEGGGGEGDGGGGGEPDFGGYLDDANGFDGEVEDATGQDEVTVEVGAGSDGFAFAPAAVHVDSGVTVAWEWTGEGGAHNVVHDDGEFDSGDPVAESGVNFEHTFEEDGVYNYYCAPHESVGMKGSVVVGEDYPTAGGGSESGSGGGPTFPESALSIGVATSFVMSATLALAYFFMRYGGDYESLQ